MTQGKDERPYPVAVPFRTSGCGPWVLLDPAGGASTVADRFRAGPRALSACVACRLMRKLIAYEFVTFDGAVEAPGGEPTHPHGGWAIDHVSPEQEHHSLDEALAAESLLPDRVTDDVVSDAWPSREGEFGDKMNSMPKHVHRARFGIRSGTRPCSTATRLTRSSRSRAATAEPSSRWTDPGEAPALGLTRLHGRTDATPAAVWWSPRARECRRGR